LSAFEGGLKQLANPSYLTRAMVRRLVREPFFL